MLRATRTVSLLLAGERGARWYTVQPSPHASFPVAHTACDEHAAAGHSAAATTTDAACVHWNANACTASRAVGARSDAPAQPPGGLSPGSTGRARSLGRTRAATARCRCAARCQRHPLLLRL